MASPQGETSSTWDFDCTLLEDLPPFDDCFQWAQPHDALPPPTTLSADNDSFGNPDSLKDSSSRKRLRSGACGVSDSKAYKEKLRRDKLNDRFQELSSILEPGRPPKMDKAVILSDAVHMVIQLREEAHKLKQEYNNLQGKVNELKVEKNEVRVEKLKLKAEKEKLEQQVKALSTPPVFLPHPPPLHAPFIAPSQRMGSKMMQFVGAGYPAIPMWSFMPPSAVDTSEDQFLRPPVA